jgi:hypothetical protein
LVFVRFPLGGEVGQGLGQGRILLVVEGALLDIEGDDDLARFTGEEVAELDGDHSFGVGGLRVVGAVSSALWKQL